MTGKTTGMHVRKGSLVGAAMAGSLLAMGGGLACAAPLDLTLVKDGAPAAAIVLATQPTRAAQLAAFELQHHVRLITRATLPIVAEDATVPGVRILVGESGATRALGFANDGLAPQEYLIRFLPDTLVLIGRDKKDGGRVDYDYLTNPNASDTWVSLYAPQGTMYAAYDFLEKFCGVRWINPTDFGTLCPHAATLTVKGEELRRRPFMAFRGGSAAGNSGIGRGYGDAADYQYGGGLWRGNTAQAEAYMAAAYPRLKAVYPDARFTSALRAQNLLFQYRMKAGGDQRQCSHSFYNYYPRFFHKDRKGFESYRPEYFAQGYEGDEPPQLCYGNPATIAQVVQDARHYFDAGGKQWGEDYFALEPMDNASFCRCALCAPQYEPARESEKSQHSTYWFRFVNAVATEVAKTHPGKSISTLAYMTHEGLPTGFGLESNVVVHFCVSANRSGAAGGQQGLAKQLARLQEWRDKQPNVPMYLWLYNTFPLEIANNGRFHCFPGFFAREIKRQFDYFHKLGVEGIFHCGFNGEVENYLTYKLMDDPTLDLDALLADYFAAYGPAAKPMRAWYDLVESRFMDPSALPLVAGKPYVGHQTVAVAWDYLGNAETMAKLGALMDEARGKAAGEGARRVELWDKGVWSYMQTGRQTYVERMRAPIPSVTAARVPAAKGDPGKVAWDKAADLGDKWYARGGKDPSKRTFRGRVCHDGEFFYLELTEENVAMEQLVASAVVFPADVWEPLFARQRAQPFRQYAVGPTGMARAISHGEINWRQDVEMPETGIRAVADTTGNRWVTRLSWPLTTLVD
ncbi:MAG: DUF4838 domain-containing protein, partial [Kiritimatiellae bacterium]|nr:DUF4838 domain-containing protein [Kiritimatiellia bacterium]